MGKPEDQKGLSLAAGSGSPSEEPKIARNIWKLLQSLLFSFFKKFLCKRSIKSPQNVQAVSELIKMHTTYKFYSVNKYLEKLVIFYTILGDKSFFTVQEACVL